MRDKATQTQHSQSRDPDNHRNPEDPWNFHPNQHPVEGFRQVNKQDGKGERDEEFAEQVESANENSDG